MTRIYKTNKTHKVVYNNRKMLEYRILILRGPSEPVEGNREDILAPPLTVSTPITIRLINPRTLIGRSILTSSAPHGQYTNHDLTRSAQLNGVYKTL